VCLKPLAPPVLLCAALVVAIAPLPTDADEALLLSLEACIADTAAREDAKPDAAAERDEGDGEPRLTELEQYCPEVHAGLKDSWLAPYLERDWEYRIGTAKLERLHSLVGDPSMPATRSIDTASLAGIAERLKTLNVESERSLWQRFKDWLRQLFERQAAAAEESGWFDEWLREHWPSDTVMKAIAFGILAILVGGIAWLVYVELRAAGLIGRRRVAAADATGNPLPARGEPRLSPSLAEATDTELPGLLVGLLLEQLRRLGWVQDRLSMTHRELGRAVRFDSAADSDTFDDLLRISELMRYAAAAPAAPTVRAAVEGARRLLDGLARQAPGTT
jgi:hypothetical protein